ncbi:MAG: hypothetical protein RIR54_394, partial [Actinomycetota bacterium]
SHKLGEVVDISDRITVMRGGKVTGSVRRGEADVRRLAELMVGRQINIVPRRAKSPTGDVLLSASQVHLERDGAPVLTDINLEVRGGEILGVAGVAGNGQRDLAEVIAGLRSPQQGNPAAGQRHGVRHPDGRQGCARCASRWAGVRS